MVETDELRQAAHIIKWMEDHPEAVAELERMNARRIQK